MTPDAPSLVEPVRRTVDGLIASFVDEGAGVPIIAVHGLPGTQRDFRWLAPCVSPHARFVRVDLPGWGETDRAHAPTLSIPERARFVRRLMDALGIERAVVIGHSMGGATAVALAAEAPERVAGLGLLSSAPLTPHRSWRQSRPDLLGRVVQLPVLGRAMLPVLRRGMISAGFSRTLDLPTVRYTLECAGALDFAAHRDAVARLRCPTMVAWCDDDPLVEGALSRVLAEGVPEGPRLSFATGGHNPQKTWAVELGEALVPFAEGCFEGGR